VLETALTSAFFVFILGRAAFDMEAVRLRPGSAEL
jgi:hypothetical protein